LYSIRACSDIAEIEPSAWNAIVDADDLQASHEFVSVCQRADVEQAAYRHVMVYRDEQLVGIASFSRMDVHVDLLTTGLARTAVRWVRRLRPSFLVVPVAFCGLPVSFGQSCLRLRPDADEAMVLSLLARELERFARDSGAELLCFKEYEEAQRATLSLLTSAGYVRAPSLPSCRLAIRWRSFDEYLGALRAGYRRQVRASLRVQAERGLTSRVVGDFGAECARIFGLYEQVMDRAQFQLERLNLAFFQELNTRLGEQSGAILLERDGTLVAAAVLLYAPHVITFLLAGIDDAANRQCAAYPNLVTAVVAEAIRRGATHLEMGQTSYDLKLRLGAKPTDRDIYLRHPGRLQHTLLRAGAPILFPVTRPAARRALRV
jgi:predicted N-acyltransferase